MNEPLPTSPLPTSPQPTSPRQRLNTLLAIPERERTDAEWDEINELEIILAPGNREDAPRQSQSQPQQPRRNNTGAAPNGFAKPATGTPHKKPFKKQRKPPRSRPPTP